jgi:IPT/TIG domain-containing protein
MAPFKRHSGLRVTAVAFAVSTLLVLGLQAPALAAAPTISSFSPTSGPTGCVVAIRGTNFDNPIVTSVDIGGTSVSAFKVVSGTEIWATVAGDARGAIHVTNARETASSAKAFTNANPGGCSPTVFGLIPCSGTTTVTVYGMNLLKSSGTGTSAAVGGDVRFAPYTDPAAHTGMPETPTQLRVVVPTNVTTGPIRVSTFNDIIGEGAVLSDVAFYNEPGLSADCFFVETSRSVTLRLARSLVARGTVSDDKGFTACAASVPVKIMRRVAGEWKTVRTTRTSSTGSYKERIPDKPGRYRAKAPGTLVTGDVGHFCLPAISPVRTRRS